VNFLQKELYFWANGKHYSESDSYDQPRQQSKSNTQTIEREPEVQSESEETELRFSPQYHALVDDALDILHDCDAWEMFWPLVPFIENKQHDDFCGRKSGGHVGMYIIRPKERIPPGGISPIFVCDCILDADSEFTSPVNFAFMLLHEFNHVLEANKGNAYGGMREEKECDNFAKSILSKKGYKPIIKDARF
jgi:hypothetical protein